MSTLLLYESFHLGEYCDGVIIITLLVDTFSFLFVNTIGYVFCH